VHSWIHRIWPNCGMQAGLALRTVLACIWACAGNQIGMNCTTGTWIRACAGNQSDPWCFILCKRNVFNNERVQHGISNLMLVCLSLDYHVESVHF